MKIIKYKKYIARLLVVTVSIMLIIGSVPASASYSSSVYRSFTFGRKFWTGNCVVDTDNIYSPTAMIINSGRVAFSFSNNNRFSVSYPTCDLFVKVYIDCGNENRVTYNELVLPKCSISYTASEYPTVVRTLELEPFSQFSTVDPVTGSLYLGSNGQFYVLYCINYESLCGPCYDYDSFLTITDVTFSFSKIGYEYFSFTNPEGFFYFGMEYCSLYNRSNGSFIPGGGDFGGGGAGVDFYGDNPIFYDSNGDVIDIGNRSAWDWFKEVGIAILLNRTLADIRSSEALETYLNPNSSEFLFKQNAFTFLGDRIVDKLDYLSAVLQIDWNLIEPILEDILDNGIIPSLNAIISSLTNIVSEFVIAFSPLIADIVNFFSPYFIDIIGTLQSEITRLISNINEPLREFFDDITPSISGLSSAIATAFEDIIKALFIPSQDSVSSSHYTDFKTEFESKFPIFGQLKTFLTTLFNPLNYSDDYLVQYEFVEIERTKNLFDPFSFPDVVLGSYYGRCLFGKLSDRYYTLSFTLKDGVTLPSNFNFGFVYRSSSNNALTSYNGWMVQNGIIKSRTRTIDTDFLSERALDYGICVYPKNLDNWDFLIENFNIQFESGSFSTAYAPWKKQTYTSLNQTFLVDVYGKKVSILDFSWYLPYKHYGDICILAFCYLAFVWHTFKKIPSFI